MSFGGFKKKNSGRRTNGSGLLTGRHFNVRFRRTAGEIAILTGDDLSTRKETIQVRVILNELSTKGLFLFSPKPIPAGASIGLTIKDPKMFYVKGRVLSSQEVSTHHGILSEQSFHHRVDIAFEFTSDEEKKRVEEYLNYLNGQVLKDAA